MKKIESKHHDLYRSFKKLSQSNYQQKKQGIAWLEGIHLAQECLAAQITPRFCLINESKFSNFEIQKIIQGIDQKSICLLSSTLFESLTETAYGVKLILIIDRPIVANDFPVQTNLLILDGLQDPGNVGSILRTAVAVGISYVVAMPHTAHLWSEKVLRSAMGAHFKLKLFEDFPIDRLKADLKIPMVILDSHAKQSIYQSNLKRPLAWVLGNEGAGVSSALRALAKETLSIPHSAETESLNVAAAAAVCLFEQYRQSLI